MAVADIKIEIMNTEFDAVVEYDYTPAVQAKLDALPEDCYPAESEEVCVHSLLIGDSNGEYSDYSGLIDLIHDDLVEAIKESE